MAKFIELTSENEGIIFLNVEQIVFLKPEETGTRIYFPAAGEKAYLVGRSVKESYQTVKALLVI